MNGITINNAAGIECPHNGRIVGEKYPQNERCTKDVPYFYGYSKSDNGYVFDGWADIDIDAVLNSLSESEQRSMLIAQIKIMKQSSIRSKSERKTLSMTEYNRLKAMAAELDAIKAEANADAFETDDDD